MKLSIEEFRAKLLKFQKERPNGSMGEFCRSYKLSHAEYEEIKSQFKGFKWHNEGEYRKVKLTPHRKADDKRIKNNKDKATTTPTPIIDKIIKDNEHITFEFDDDKDDKEHDKEPLVVMPYEKPRPSMIIITHDQARIKDIVRGFINE